MAHRNRLADFPDRESSPKARGRASVSVRTPRKQGDSARQRRKQHTPSPYFPTAWGSLAPVVLRSARTRSSKERDGERCRWRTRATSPEAHHSSKEREIQKQAEIEFAALNGCTFTKETLITHRFSHWLAERQRTRDHRDWSHVRSRPFLPRVVRPC